MMLMPVDEAQDFLLFFASPPRQNTAASHDGCSLEPFPIV
jgi:hypothetical protein